MAIIPSRSPGRQPLRSPFWSKRWKRFIIPAAVVCILVQILFLANMLYFYGALFKSGSRVHALRVLAINYDGGDIGEALSKAYQGFKGDAFPTLQYRPASEYPTEDSLRGAVCKEGYWAAIYTHPGASDRLAAAISGKNTEYNASDAISYIYDGAYYPVVTSAMIESSLQTLIGAASRVYYSIDPDTPNTVNFTNPVSSSAFLNPIQASSSIIMPTTHGSRVLLNTVSMVMPPLMQFFFLMALNGIFAEARVFTKLSKRDVYITRLIIGKIHTLLGALGMAGYIWTFREDWTVSGSEFAETWMCVWLYMEVNYVIVDTLLETVIPIKFFAFFMLTWVILNVSSTVYPYELSAGFYRWGYALPAHETWLLLMDIWSGGCKHRNETALPILLSWWFFGHFSSAWAVRKRCLAAADSAREKELDLDELSRDLSDESTQDRGRVLVRVSANRPSRMGTPVREEPYDIESSREIGRLREGSDSRTVIDDIAIGDGEAKI
ncbi:hypothetical protein EDB80DRAFT_880314 [Ilyonectria destructans]|nr:hypothetical protein EDB80DRAFT_880314 [Ilyonectria destructans]